MSPDPRSSELLTEIAGAAEVLDRGLRGPAWEVGALRGHGWLQAALPSEMGGKGWGQSAAGANDGFTALFSLASASLPATRLYEGHINAIRLIDRHGTPAQRDRFLAEVRDGALLAIWGAEGDRPTRIVAADHNHALHGTKTFASGLGEVAYAIVTARDEQGACQMVIAPAGEPHRWRTEVWDVTAMVGTSSGEFNTDHLPASQEWLLGQPGALWMEPDFNGGVWRLCAGYAGAMTAIASATLDHARQRGLCDDAPTRLRLGHIAHHAHTALLWSWQACRTAELPGETNRAVATSLFAREAIESAAAAQLQLVERIAGTSLHRRGSALGRHVRDLRFFLRQAALDGKLDTALSLWQDQTLFLLDDLQRFASLPC